MNGFAYALALSLGEEPRLESLDDAESVLREHGEVVFEDGETLLVVIGEYGYATHGLLGKLVDCGDLLTPLKGRRVFFPSRSDGIEGTAPLQRAYTLIVNPDGEVLHINRFHDTPWAPVEPRCTRDLMAEINPGLTLDLHEFGGSAFWFSARRQQNDDDQTWEQRMADAMIKAIAEAGVDRMPEDYLPGSFFTKQEPSVYWLDAQERGEGLNLADFAANRYGPAFTIETGMRGRFQQRVENSMLAATTAVRVFEERYR